MVQLSVTAISLALSLLSLQANLAAATGALEARQQSPNIVAVHFDSSTGKFVYTESPSNSKRSVEQRGYPTYNENALVSSLRGHNAYGFCKSYCANSHGPGYPGVTVTTTTTTTSTATVPKTTTRPPQGYYHTPTLTKTITAALPPAYTSTVTTTTVVTVTSTSLADTSTATTSTTSTTTALTTVTSTSTSTIPFPTTTAPSRRSVSLPAYLNGYSEPQIISACEKLVPPTVTVTRSAVRTVTHTYTVYSQPTVTVLTTTTPAAQTVTTTTTAGTTTTLTSTSTPLTTVTSTAITTTTLTSTTSTTTTVCPSSTPFVNGVGVTTPGSLQFPSANDQADCCSACFNTPGCNVWAYLSGSCIIGTGSAPQDGSVTTACPHGLGTYEIDTGTGGSGDVGGAGQCGE